jgi:molybdate/tungstate transport system substrate-binding protein
VGRGERRGGSGALLVLVALTLAATSLTLLAACGGHDDRHVSLVFAGSLIVPFDRLATEFERTHPGLQVTTEAHGSIQAIRQVTDLGRQFDLVVTADAQLIPPLMYDKDVPGTGQPFASWYVTFATNRMVLAISPKSPLADQFTVQNWYKLLTRPGVRFGLADPRFDPAGYRALMVLQLAERYYHDPIIFENVVMGQFTTPVIVERQGQRDVIQVPEILETQPGSSVVLRDESIELDALLETGDLDCAFEYESVARQSGLRYLRLPAAIDLGEQRYANVYGGVAVKLASQRFAGVKPMFAGGVIKYALTIPSNAPDPQLAREFAAWLLGPAARQVFAATYQPLITPPQADHYDLVPEEVRQACARPG